ncbi:nucleotide exchange factor GrpE [Rhodoligotrophos ferricapiens]|uniref:nucleotide exchange factor GrpE n=1 Tax=Rhodoligotrophos ferricapiens TaxID=3069264 RepID=UPI00315D930D
MIEDTKTTSSPEKQNGSQAVNAPSEQAEAHENEVNENEAQAEELSPETMVAAIQALQAENDSLKDKLLRAMADQENLRRRTEREKGEASQYAITSFARDLLSVIDNFGRALASAPSKDEPAVEEAVKNLVVGVEMTEREMLNVLEKHGVRRDDPLGQRFDPNFHQAMFEVEDPSQPAGTVVQVMQTGYRIGERILRPALVGVSKGGPKPSSPA